MKILNISLDSKILDNNSAVAKRVIGYGSLVDKYVVLVLAHENKIINLSEKVKVIAVKKNFCRIYNFLKLKFNANKILSEKLDIITVQDSYFVGYLAAKLAKKFNIGLEIQVHGFEKFNGIRKILAKRVLKKANAVRVVSQRLRKKLISEFNVSGDKITVVPIYVKVRKLESYKVKKHNDEFIFLTVGRLVPVKNIEMQIEAVKKLKSLKVEKNFELWIIGDGPERKKLEKLCYALGVTRYVRFLGWQDDLEKYYSQADAFLLTSSSEGWGMAIVEAASFGLPIIMTDVGLAGEVIKNNESGIVIPVGYQPALEYAMIRLVENEDLRKKLGAGAYQAIQALPNHEQTIKKMIDSWKKAMENK